MSTAARCAMAVLGLAFAAAGATAQVTPQVIVEGPAGDAALCPPCATLWATGVPTGASAVFHITDEGAPGSPMDMPTEGIGAGLGTVNYKPFGQGPMSVFVTVGGEVSPAGGCIPPIHPAGDCPPGPGHEIIRVRAGLALVVPYEPSEPPVVKALLNRLELEPRAHWQPLEVGVSLSGRPPLQATFSGEGFTAGTYRAQFLAKDGRVMSVRLIEVGGRRKE